MKRKPCTKVPIPVSPKKRLRSFSSQTNYETKQPVTLDVDLITKPNESSQEDYAFLKAKSPFYKKVVEQPRNTVKTKAAREIDYGIADVDMATKAVKEKMAKETNYARIDIDKTTESDKSYVDKSDLLEGERSSVSLNSSYVTISTANSSLSQDSLDPGPEDRLCSSQSSKEGFTFDRSSDGTDQLDYDDTLTSGEKTPNSTIFSPGNKTVDNTEKTSSLHGFEKKTYRSINLTRSSTSEPVEVNKGSQAVEVVREKNMLDIIDFDMSEECKQRNHTGVEEFSADLVRDDIIKQPGDRGNNSTETCVEKISETTAAVEQSRKFKDISDCEVGKTNLGKNVEVRDRNNNLDEIHPQDHISDQEIMSKSYQLPMNKTDTSDESKDKNSKDVCDNGISDQELMSQGYQFTTGDRDDSKENVMPSKQFVMENGRQVETIPVPALHKGSLIGNQTAFSEIMPHDLEPRQLMQVRQEGQCPLSPISEENLAVERVAKELVNTYGGQNSNRIPEILHHESGVSDYDYASFGTNLPYQPPRDPRQQDHQLQVTHRAEYASDRGPPSQPPSQLTNSVPFGDPQASSTPEIYQRKPICFSPDDFPSPYSNFEVPLPNQSWQGYPNSYPQNPPPPEHLLSQNPRQPEYYLPENPLSTPGFGQTATPRSGYKGKGIIDLQGGGDYRPPQSHDITTMTFTPRALMESHLCSNYYSNNSQNNVYPKENGSGSAVLCPLAPPLTNMDCSSIYPSREFIEKNSGSSYQSITPARVPSYDTLVPPPKKRKLKSFSETDLVNDQMPVPGRYHLGLPPIETKFGPQRQKYYVVNPSDATTMPPKTLISKYIDFLILENEQITEISKSVSQPVDIYVTEDMYFMDTLKVKVPFPSKKFMEWVSSFYPKLRLENMRFQGMGRDDTSLTGSDSRPTQQVLEDIFYFFQREAMTLEGEESFCRS